MRQSCRLILSALGGFGVALGSIGAGLSSACAQEATGPYGMQFSVTPYYLWLSGINTAIKTPIPQRPELDSEVGPFQLLGHLNGVPFFGAFEVRQGPLGFLGDVMHVPVRTSITTRDVFYNGGTAELKVNMGTGLVVYRLLDQPTQSVDAGLGFLGWGFNADVSLNPGLLVARTVTGAQAGVIR
jgi:hypothetical protein